MRSASVKVELDGRSAARAIAKLGEAMKLVNERMAVTAASTVRALQGTRRLLEALSGPPTAEERLYARRSHRALSRSIRNQPSVHPDRRYEAGRVCPECGGPGVLVYDRHFDGEHYQDEALCPRCKGEGLRPRRRSVASASRKRRPHGRPR